MYATVKALIRYITHWLFDWLIDWLIDWVMDRSIDWSIGWLMMLLRHSVFLWHLLESVTTLRANSCVPCTRENTNTFWMLLYIHMHTYKRIKKQFVCLFVRACLCVCVCVCVQSRIFLTIRPYLRALRQKVGNGKLILFIGTLRSLEITNYKTSTASIDLACTRHTCLHYWRTTC